MAPPTGFTGLLCDSDIDNCLLHRCENNSTCESLIDSYRLRNKHSVFRIDYVINYDLTLHSDIGLSASDLYTGQLNAETNHCKPNPCINSSL